MKTETIVYCVVSLVLGMLLLHMLKGVCGCKAVEGQGTPRIPRPLKIIEWETRMSSNHQPTFPETSRYISEDTSNDKWVKNAQKQYVSPAAAAGYRHGFEYGSDWGPSDASNDSHL